MTSEDARPALTGLAERQAALVAALVAGAPLPAGFDTRRVGAAATALRRKRASEVARAWPFLAASAGPAWPAEFAAWAAGRPPRGSLVDGWEYARSRGALSGAAAEELARVEVAFTLREGVAMPRRWPAARTIPGGLVVQVGGRARRIALPRR